jgi:hydroxypyruvate reductase
VFQPDQFLTRSLRDKPWGNDVASILAAAIHAVDPYSAVKENLRLNAAQLYIGERRYNLNRIKRVFVLGAGKAGMAMAQAVHDVLGARISAGQVIVKAGQLQRETRIGAIRIVTAAHPVPDAVSEQAARQLLEIARTARRGDLVITLISGGGSALLAAPVEGLQLADLQTMSDLLVNCGAHIKEINIVRQQLDAIKAGGLARAASPARVASLILSDVVGDPLALIASGPTVHTETTHADALAILEKYELLKRIPARVRAYLAEPTPPRKSPKRVHNLLVANNQRAAHAALSQAQSLGYLVKLRTASLAGEARLIGQDIAQIWRAIVSAQPDFGHHILLLYGGESAVTLKGDGVGGRNHELALAAVSALSGLPNSLLVALATDGDDGSSGAAGAVVTGKTLAAARLHNLDPRAYLARNDSFTFFERLGDSIHTGPTGTNVGDLIFCFHFPDPQSNTEPIPATLEPETISVQHMPDYSEHPDS